MTINKLKTWVHLRTKEFVMIIECIAQFIRRIATRNAGKLAQRKNSISARNHMRTRFDRRKLRRHKAQRNHDADAFILGCTSKLPSCGNTSMFAHFVDNTTGKAIEYRVYIVTDSRVAENATTEQREIRVVCRKLWKCA
jgi:hypothetical protein